MKQSCKKNLFTLFCIAGLSSITACGKQAEANTVPTESAAGENIPLSTSGFGQAEKENSTMIPSSLTTSTEMPSPSPVPTNEEGAASTLPKTSAPNAAGTPTLTLAPTSAPIPTLTPALTSAPTPTLTPAPTFAATLTKTSAPASTPTPTPYPVPTDPPESPFCLTATPYPIFAQNSGSNLPFSPGGQQTKETSYLKFSIPDGVDVYFSEDDERPQVIVSCAGQYYFYDWDYHLDYGEPIVSLKHNPHEIFDKPNETLLSIVVPTRKLTEPLSFAAGKSSEEKEICGEEHLLDYNALLSFSGETPSEITPEYPELQADIKLGYAEKHSGEKVFTLTLFSEDTHMENGEYHFEYPKISLPEQKNYTPVFDDALHFTDSGMRYRRFGVSDGETSMWLGKFCNSCFFPDGEIGYYVTYWGKNPLPDAKDAMPYQARPLAPETWLDLDGDGTPEKITYRVEKNVESNGYSNCYFAVTINDTTYWIGDFSVGSIFGNYLFYASLDGKTNQLMLLDYDDRIPYSFRLYAYKDGALSKAGVLNNLKYNVTEQDGKWMISCLEPCHPLQNDTVEMQYQFVDGYLKNVPKEYYEFLEHWDSMPNEFTVLQDVPLYTAKNGTETFILPKGSHAALLGGDLADWILVEDKDNERQGWLKVKWDAEDWDYYAVFYCILPDGDIVLSDDLFEGLRRYE